MERTTRRPKTNVYIDGFNLYYRALKGTPYKWLDLGRLCELALPKNDIHRIRYFTALVKQRAGDPSQLERQQVYLRALKTIPNLSVHRGHFLETVVSMRLARPPAEGSPYVKVLKSEEKGSDVNIATYLLVDAFDKDFDVAVVVSNDSDLEEPIRMVREKFDLPVGLLNPSERPSQALLKVVAFYKEIRRGLLESSQFPDEIEYSSRRITKPAKW